MKAIFPAALLFAATLASPVTAAQYDLTRARCEDPKLKPIIMDVLSTATFSDGHPVASEGLSLSAIVSISTISTSKNKLVCKMVVNVGFRGTSQPIRGKFTIWQPTPGKLMGKWSPFS